MAKSSAAKKQANPNKFRGGPDDTDICVNCGHDDTAHLEPDGGCPALPPSKQVTVDEAVVSKGGKPSTDFERSLAAATGDDERKAKLRLAEVHFDRRTNEPTRAKIPLQYLRAMKNNPRSELGDVSALVKSIENNGFVGALSVREVEENVFEVWAGNRRLKAAKLAGLDEVPCDVYDLTEVQALELNLTEQINREDLSPLEEGTACRALMELSAYTSEQVAEKLGQSTSWVLKRTALCGLAPELKKSLAEGALSLTVANALASLPTQQLQIKALDAIDGHGGPSRQGNADDQVQFIRSKTCRPLADATWKLTDADLLPEAGACSTCPFNSATNAMPGLFDNAKAKPTCAKTECFDDKAAEAWLAKTSKQKAAGAKVLSLAEGKKLFHGQGGPLPESSRYLEATELAKKDRSGRTWKELCDALADEHQPQLHLAQDGAGKLRQLYVGDKLLEALATHLKLKWAANVVEEATSAREKPQKEQAKAEAEMLLKRELLEASRLVTSQVLATAAAKLASDFTRPAALWLASDFERDASLEAFGGVLGRKLPKDWFQKGATLNELMAFVWWSQADREFGHPWNGFDEAFMAIAKAHGFKLEEMVKAQLATTRAEAAKAKS